jgi:RIO-like serine/threonine protein kinase
MELVRENKEKQRAMYFCGDRYKKIWYNKESKWVIEHVETLKKVLPDYVLDYGENWIDFKIIPGTPANTMEHTDDFIKRIYNFCLDNILTTLPYAHGDWTLSNIIINGDSISMVDWDNIGRYQLDEIFKKLDSDLESAFGKRYRQVIYDPTIV